MKGGEGPPADVQQDVEPGVKAGAEPPTERAAHLANHKSKVSMALQEHVNNKRMRSPWRWGARRGLIEFYNRQNSILDGQLDMEAVHRGDANFDTSAEERYIQRALNLSFVSNVILLGVRAAMVALAGSLSLIIALIDAVLDVLSSCMMYYAAREARKPHNKIKYPVGTHFHEYIVYYCL